MAGDDIVRPAGTVKVQRDGGELHEQHLIVVGDIHRLAQQPLRFVPDLIERRGAVAHLHDAHAGALVVHQVIAAAADGFALSRSKIKKR